MAEFDLERFKIQQRRSYQIALDEIRNGRKESHWIWWILPQQIKGLGYSYNSEFYGLDGVEEARAYFADDELKHNLLEIKEALMDKE